LRIVPGTDGETGVTELDSGHLRTAFRLVKKRPPRIPSRDPAIAARKFPSGALAHLANLARRNLVRRLRPRSVSPLANGTVRSSAPIRTSRAVRERKMHLDPRQALIVTRLVRKAFDLELALELPVKCGRAG